MRIPALTPTLAVLIVATAAAQDPSREVVVAVLSGGYAVPAVETHASGTAELTLVGSQLHYQIHVDSTRDATGAYLHIGRAGQREAAVADLLKVAKPGPVAGLLASGTLRSADLHQTTMQRLIDALRKNDAYITVHTLSHPDGEMRGELRMQPTVATR
jgi:hypothetical protein